MLILYQNFVRPSEYSLYNLKTAFISRNTDTEHSYIMHNMRN